MPKKKTEVAIVEATEAAEIEFEIPEFDEEEEKFSDAEIAGIADLAEEILRDAKTSTQPSPVPTSSGDLERLEKKLTDGLSNVNGTVAEVAVHLTKLTYLIETVRELVKTVQEMDNRNVRALFEMAELINTRLGTSEAPAAPTVNRSPSTVATSGTVAAPTEGPAATIRQWLTKLPKDSQYGLDKISRAIATKLGISESSAASIVCDQADLVSVVSNQVRVL